MKLGEEENARVAISGGGPLVAPTEDVQLVIVDEPVVDGPVYAEVLKRAVVNVEDFVELTGD
jgi:hypothetical protein